MPRKRPPFVECWRDRHGQIRLYFRRGKGQRIPLPNEIGSDEFNQAYAAALDGASATAAKRRPFGTPGTLAALIVSYKNSASYRGLNSTSKKGYTSRLEAIAVGHGHRSVAGLTKERIESILKPYANLPGAALDAEEAPHSDPARLGVA